MKRSSACSPATSSLSGWRDVDLLAPRRRGHEQPRAGLGAHEVVQELERLKVAPLHVVGDQQQRRGGGEERPGDRVEEPLAVLALGQRLGGREVGPLGEQLGQQPRELGQVRAIEATEPRRDRLRAQPGDHGPVGDRALRRVRAGLCGERAAVGAPRAQLLDQAALADAGLAGHEHELRAAALRRAPQAVQARSLARARDERRAGLDRARRGSDGEQRLVRLARRRRGLDGELALQRRRAHVVDAQRSRAVAARVVQAHEQPVGLLSQRVVADQALGVAERRGRIAALVRLAHEPLERVAVQVAQPLALLEQPVVVAALEQVARVGLDGRLQPALRERLLEVGDVEPQRRLVPPPEHARPDVDEPVRVGERAPQVVQDVAQVRPRLRLGGVGPEQEREPLAWLRRAPVQQQVREQ